MKNLALLLLLLIPQFIIAQQLDVEGKVKIDDMDKNNTADSVVVRLADGTLAVRDASSLSTTADSPWYLGKDTLDGIVFYIYLGADGQEHGLIVSKTESSEIWQNTGTDTGADRSWDGDYNTDQMTDSPVKNYIATNFSSEWYLPSTDEWNILWGTRFHVNKAMFDGGHTLISSTSTYWTSTETSTTQAGIILMNNGSFGGGAKTGSRPTRAIRAF